jgi:multidrug efflux pump subunit AcrA (membrane-fusion protein)
MAGRASLNAKNLEALGTAQLAALLLQHTEGNAAARRALRLALAEQQGPLEMAQEVRKRLAAVERSSSWLDQKRRDALLADLDRQRQAIAGPIAAHDPDLAHELLWRFLDLAKSLGDRCDCVDEGELPLFHQASADLGQVTCRAKGSTAGLAEQVAAALLENDIGQYDHLIEHLKEALKPDGLGQLRQIMESHRPPSKAEDETEEDGDGYLYAPIFNSDYEPDGDEEFDIESEAEFDINFESDYGDESESGYEDDYDEDYDLDPDPNDLDQTVRLAMLAIADALDDAEAYLAEYRDHQPAALRQPLVAARVAQRLTAAGRAAEALALLDAAQPLPHQTPPGPRPWIDARIAALDLLERGEAAQQLRWKFALLRLSSQHLHDYLKRLPAFEDGEAQERALDLVLEHPYLGPALEFLHQWPDRRRCASLIVARPAELDRVDEKLLAAVAEALEADQPLAATLCLRALIESILEQARSNRYRHAVRHLASCRRLAGAIIAWGTIPDHNSYINELLYAYGHRVGFMNQLDPDNLLVTQLPGDQLEAD